MPSRVPEYDNIKDNSAINATQRPNKASSVKAGSNNPFSLKAIPSTREEAIKEIAKRVGLAIKPEDRYICKECKANNCESCATLKEGLKLIRSVRLRQSRPRLGKKICVCDCYGPKSHIDLRKRQENPYHGFVDNLINRGKSKS